MNPRRCIVRHRADGSSSFHLNFGMERESSIRLSKWCLIHNAVFATWVESKIVCSVPPCLQVDISKA